MRLPLVGGAYPAELTAAASECINRFPEFIEDPENQGKNKGILRKCPGVHKLITLPESPIYGIWSGGGRLWAVAGTSLYEVGQGTYPFTPNGGTVISSGYLSTPAPIFPGGPPRNPGPVSMFANGNQLGVVFNGQFYYDNGLGPIAATFAGTVDPVTAFTGAYLDGCALVNRPAGGTPDLGLQVAFSDPFDFSMWRGLSFFSKEADASYVQSILADREQLYVFGREGSEVWQFDPNTGVPARVPGAAAREGSVSPWAPASLAQSVFFLGGSPRGQTIAYRLRGFTPVRVSTSAVEKAWSDSGANPYYAVSSAYIDPRGHQFWEIHFPNPANTWVYDVTASEQAGYPIWHQRSRWTPPSGGLSGFFDTYPYWFHTFLREWGTNGQGMHVVGHRETGQLYEMSDAFGDEDGADIYWRRAIPYRYNGGKQIYFGRQDLEMETGLTAAVAPAPEPVITRDYSDDRGHTWVNPEPAGIGLSGDYARRVWWPPAGASRGRVWRYAGNSQTPDTLVDLQAEDTEGVV